MQANSLKLKNIRKNRKTVGRGGKKGTYCGRGNKGQKARSGGNVDPLFEGGRSTLIDHMKKKKGFKSGKIETISIKISDLEKKVNNGDLVNFELLAKAGLLNKNDYKKRIKILGNEKLTKRITIDENIFVSKSVKGTIEKVGGKVNIKKEKTSLKNKKEN